MNVLCWDICDVPHSQFFVMLTWLLRFPSLLVYCKETIIYPFFSFACCLWKHINRIKCLSSLIFFLNSSFKHFLFSIQLSLSSTQNKACLHNKNFEFHTSLELWQLTFKFLVNCWKYFSQASRLLKFENIKCVHLNTNCMLPRPFKCINW